MCLKKKIKSNILKWDKKLIYVGMFLQTTILFEEMVKVINIDAQTKYGTIK